MSKRGQDTEWDASYGMEEIREFCLSLIHIYTGDIIAQEVIEIGEEDTSHDLYLKCMEKGTKLVIEYMDMLLDGDVYKRQEKTQHQPQSWKD